ncbi:hypothetical protein DAEQUDRAFT_728589 [Daedalea quercina L-15889]|uniref:Uncharacterized protein n=1 Tax=Daedalea quercina L-15889 TaxID=1314783 RepID=A0A165MWW3_9APHY|nr:hypothetical protein DAEQUDRAFT_730590 [Daedalea quercina L-15889]KZT67822.1 hypothetical protein DAEQUDRAFT_728589 [Daedalea quercina L-15889]
MPPGASQMMLTAQGGQVARTIKLNCLGSVCGPTLTCLTAEAVSASLGETTAHHSRPQARITEEIDSRLCNGMALHFPFSLDHAS